MRRLLRFLAVSLLAVALPLQSMAAVAMVGCMASASASASASAGAAADERAVHPGHHDDTPDAATDPAAHAPAGTHCASCGVAAMLPSVAVAAPASVVSVRFTAAVRPDAPTFLTDGPDRPPRTGLD